MSMSDSDTEYELIEEQAKETDRLRAEKMALEARNRVQELDIQELKNKIAKLEEEKDLEIKDLQATIEQMKEDNSGNPLICSLMGSWKASAPIELNGQKQLKTFPEEKRKRFEMLLQTETYGDMVKYFENKGLVYHWATLRCGRDFSRVSSFTHKTWTNKITFFDGQEGEIVKKMEGSRLKMVLKSNEEEMTCFWQRETSQKSLFWFW